MKKNNVKNLLKMLAVVLPMCYTGNISAHFKTNQAMIGKTTQVFRLVCPAGVASVRAAVLDGNANTGVMSVTIFKDESAQTTSDRAQGNTSYGPLTSLAAGEGVYYLIASQTSVHPFVLYNIEYHCDDINGNELPDAGPGVPSLTLIQS